jgi:hypothetical protein
MFQGSKVPGPTPYALCIPASMLPRLPAVVNLDVTSPSVSWQSPFSVHLQSCPGSSQWS